MRLPSPVLVSQIWPSMLVTCQLVWHVRTLRLIVQWIRCVIKYPFPWKHITTLWIWAHFPPTRLKSLVSPPDFPATILLGRVTFTESIQNLWNPQKDKNQNKNIHHMKIKENVYSKETGLKQKKDSRNKAKSLQNLTKRLPYLQLHLQDLALHIWLELLAHGDHDLSLHGFAECYVHCRG